MAPYDIRLMVVLLTFFHGKYGCTRAELMLFWGMGIKFCCGDAFFEVGFRRFSSSKKAMQHCVNAN